MQCDFQPLLDPKAPRRSAVTASPARSLWPRTSRTASPAGRPSDEVVYTGGIHEPWQSTPARPATTPGKVAFGPAPDEGQCVNGARATSPAVTRSPARSSRSGERARTAADLRPLRRDRARLRRRQPEGEHQRRRVHGHPGRRPTSTTRPTHARTGAAGNTNPLAGEHGFTGTDGGTLKSGWGTSQVDLEPLGAEAGRHRPAALRHRSRRLRRRRRAGTSTTSSWSTASVSNTTVTAAHVPEPSTFGTASKRRRHRDGDCGRHADRHGRRRSRPTAPSSARPPWPAARRPSPCRPTCRSGRTP